MNPSLERVNKTCSALGIKPTDRILCVHIGGQTLQYIKSGTVVRSYGISTSLKPPSNVRNSLGTPLGLHQIAERIGAGQPPGMVFRGRVPIGRHFNELPVGETERNLITTRILWLRGLEPGVNSGGDVDTHDRYIYVHGTNHEDRIGAPISGGCILMRNLDVIDLYEQVRPGDLVWIAD